MKRGLSIPEQHLLKIARQTLKMPDAIAGVMGPPSKADARRIVRELTARTTTKKNALFSFTRAQLPRHIREERPITRGWWQNASLKERERALMTMHGFKKKDAGFLASSSYSDVWGEKRNAGQFAAHSKNVKPGMGRAYARRLRGQRKDRREDSMAKRKKNIGFGGQKPPGARRPLGTSARQHWQSFSPKFRRWVAHSKREDAIASAQFSADRYQEPIKVRLVHRAGRGMQIITQETVHPRTANSRRRKQKTARRPRARKGRNSRRQRSQRRIAFPIPVTPAQRKKLGSWFRRNFGKRVRVA
jgi:hypothetical protein